MDLKGNLLNLIKSFLFEKQHGVVLNGQESKLVCLRDQFWDHYFIYTYITDSLDLHIKLFAEETSMFSVVHEPVTTSVKLNKDHDVVL